MKPGGGWILLTAALIDTQTVELLMNQLLYCHIQQLSLYGELKLVMTCIIILLLNCSDSATDSQVAQSSGLLGQEGRQLPVVTWQIQATPSPKRWNSVPLPCTDSTAVRCSELKQAAQCSDTTTYALFTIWESCICQWMRASGLHLKIKACIYKACPFSAHFCTCYNEFPLSRNLSIH